MIRRRKGSRLNFIFFFAQLRGMQAKWRFATLPNLSPHMSRVIAKSQPGEGTKSYRRVKRTQSDGR